MREGRRRTIGGKGYRMEERGGREGRRAYEEGGVRGKRGRKGRERVEGEQHVKRGEGEEKRG